MIVLHVDSAEYRVQYLKIFEWCGMAKNPLVGIDGQAVKLIVDEQQVAYNT
jgi:hypothetical protein